MSRVTLITEINSDDRFDFSVRVTAKKVIREVLNKEHCPYDAEVSLTLTGDASIREMNRTFRNIDRVTDVLSFPNLSFAAPADFTGAAGDAGADCFDPDTGNLFLGDIVLNTKRVKEQAAEYGHSELREFAFLVAHSALHLCGYDHMEEDEAAVMFGKQEEVLGSLGITRSL